MNNLKFTLLLFCFTMPFSFVFSQVKIGNNPGNINAKSLIELESTSKTFVMPRMTTSQMNLITTPLVGSMIFNLTDSTIYVYRTGGWCKLTGENIKAVNALYLTKDSVKLGGNLIHNTTIGVNGKNFIFKQDSIKGNKKTVLSINNNMNVGIGNNSPDNSSLLDLSSSYPDNKKGFLPPRLNRAQRDSIISPAIGLIIYNTEMNCINYFNGLGWANLCGEMNYGKGGIAYFNYTSSNTYQTWTVPSGVSLIKVEAYGAQGGFGNNAPGDGGGIISYLNVVPGTTLRVYIGERGNNSSTSAGGPGGWNGGRRGGNSSAGYNSGGGGGATDIRVYPYGLEDRIIVAGGGGGGGAWAGGAGGDGGVINYPNGVDGTAAGGDGGKGGNYYQGGAGGNGINTGGDGGDGALGLGGAGGHGASSGGGGGGGGGYYGGGGGGGNNNPNLQDGGGGGGGSSFSSGFGTLYLAATNYSDGYLIIYW